MDYSYGLALAFGVFVGNFFFQGVLIHDLKRGFWIGLIAAILTFSLCVGWIAIKMDITYYGDGQGNWTQRVWSEQCEEDILFHIRCQGVKGHDGDHWCYRPDGSYAWSGDSDPNAACGFIPPGHKNWISPVDMMDKYHVSIHEDSEATDPELIDRLNRGETEDWETLDQPVSDPEILEMLKGRD